MYEFGKIVLVPFPFTDLSSKKLRPALVVSRYRKASEDLILLFITSRTQTSTLQDYPIFARDSFFQKTGLKVDSLIRCDKIATLNKKVVLGEIGELPRPIIRKVGVVFKRVFGF